MDNMDNMDKIVVHVVQKPVTILFLIDFKMAKSISNSARLFSSRKLR
jgi:hypothetical protein